MLVEEWLKPMELSQSAFAERLGVHVQVVNAIVRGRRSITPRMAIRLGKALRTTPMFWLNLQNHWDLWHVERSVAEERTKQRRRTAA